MESSTSSPTSSFFCKFFSFNFSFYTHVVKFCTAGVCSSIHKQSVRVRVIQMVFLLLCMAEPDKTTEYGETATRERVLGLGALEVSVLAVRVRVTKGSAWRSLPSRAYCARCDSYSRNSRGCSRTLRGLSWPSTFGFSLCATVWIRLRSARGLVRACCSCRSPAP